MIKISFIGDLMCLKAQNEASMKKFGSLNFMPQFEPVKKVFSQSDYLIGNLETPICPSRPLTEYDIRFNSSEEYLNAVKWLGVNFVSIANNHVLDQGVEGLAETIGCLERAELKYTGAYKSEEESDQISTVEVAGLKIAIIAATFGTNSQVNGNYLGGATLHLVDLLNKQKKMLLHWKPNPNAVCEEYIADEISIAASTNSKNVLFQERLKEKIQRAKQLADYVICMPHVGGQYNPHPGNYAKWIVSFIRECGADMIIAGHPHVPQKCLIEDGVFECYSLGNFACTPNVGWFLPNSFSEYGTVLHVYFDEIEKKISKVNFTIVKSLVDEDGYTTIHPVWDLYQESTTVERERLQIDCEEIISRTRGYNDNKNVIEEEILLFED